MHTLNLIIESEATQVKYDITGFGYVCQVCDYKVETRPPEWCPRCETHRVIFRKTPL